MDLALLIQSIATFIRSKGSAATKTKVLKLLYLLDIESFRETHQTLTGFDWIFYKYGPWTAQYDVVLDELAQAGKIRLASSSRADQEAIFIDSTAAVELSKAFPTYREELKVRRVLELWADRPIGELLEYVYFHTAPMRDAKRDSRLDFESVMREETPQDYRRTPSTSSPEDLKRKRKEFLKDLASRPKAVGAQFIEPTYGTDYWNAIETMEREPD
jgi:Protein of unknown function (DUF4065)